MSAILRASRLESGSGARPMSAYLRQMSPQRLHAEYPVGDAFLAGPARLGPQPLRSLQEKRFARVLRRAWEVPFYRRLWSRHGLEPGDVRGLEDITRLPVFSKSDLMRSIEEHPPFGDYHGVDLGGGADRESVVLHTTSGTTGTPQPLFFGAWDREVQNLLLARAYRLQGLRDDDVVHSVYGFGMVNGGHYVREAVVHFTNALLLPAGTGLETRSEQQVALMHHFGATVVVGFADYIKRLAEVARANGLEPGRDIPVRMISGHMGRENRSEISRAWGGAEVFDWYGVGDTGIIAAEGPRRDGLYLWEDAHFVEIIDPDTHAPVPDGRQGNLCVTTLFKDCVYPIIRFNTNDVTTALGADPHAEVQFRRISGFEGRSDNMVKLRGINLYPTSLGGVLAADPDTLGEYVCIVERRGARDEMTVLVEVRAPAHGAEERTGRIASLLRDRLGVEVAVALVGPGETAELTQIEKRQKPIRLVDRRGG